MLVKVIKQIGSRWKWIVDFVGGSVYPTNALKSDQRLYVQLDSITEASLGETISVQDIDVLILNKDGSCGGLFVCLPQTLIVPGLTEKERAVKYPGFCEQAGVDPEEVVKRIGQETKNYLPENQKDKLSQMTDAQLEKYFKDLVKELFPG